MDRARSRGPNDGRADYLDARAAARFLDVKTRTLYSYASRGLVRSEPRPGARGRQYAREDLERLKSRHDARSGHGPVAAAALLFGEPVLATAVSSIGEEGPLYRGRSAVELALDGCPFEAACELLWTSVLPERAAWKGSELTLVRRAGLLAPRRDGRVASLPFLLAVVSRLSLEHAGRGPGAERRRHQGIGDGDGELAHARRLIRTFAALAGGGRNAARAAHEETVAAVLSAALGAKVDRARGPLDVALVLTADHELNASTFAARVIAGTHAGLHACVAGALAALGGARHGGATERVESMLDGMTNLPRARRFVESRAARGEAVPGFGHALYPEGDPRATALLDLATRVAASERSLAPCAAVRRAMAEAGREGPSLDFALVALSRALGLPRGSAAVVFAVARTAGWVAHALEQRESGQLLRPRARYVGPAPAAGTRETSPMHAAATRSSGAGSR